MLNSGKKIRALRDNNNKYSNSCFVRNKFSERNKKPLNPLRTISMILTVAFDNNLQI